MSSRFVVIMVALILMTLVLAYFAIPGPGLLTPVNGPAPTLAVPR